MATWQCNILLLITLTQLKSPWVFIPDLNSGNFRFNLHVVGSIKTTFWGLSMLLNMAATDMEIIACNLAGFMFDEIWWQHVLQLNETQTWISREIIDMSRAWDITATDPIEMLSRKRPNSWEHPNALFLLWIHDNLKRSATNLSCPGNLVQ